MQKSGTIKMLKKNYKRALEANERTLGEFHPGTLTLIHNLGGLFREKKDLVNSELFFQRAVVGRKKVLGVNHPKNYNINV